MMARRVIKNKGEKIVYHQKNYSNPFFQKSRKAGRINLSLISWRVKLIIAEIIILIAGIAWFCIFSPYFDVEMVEVSGTEKTPVGDIKDLAWRQTGTRRFLVGKQKNLILFNKNELAAALNDQYFFENLSISKKFPNTIVIAVKEKTYTAVWRDAQSDKYYYINSEGGIISETNPLEIRQKDYPLIEYRGDDFSGENTTVSLSDSIKFAIELFGGMKNKKNLPEIDRFIVDSERNTVKIATTQGPQIYFNTEEAIDKQLSKLEILISEKLKNDFAKKSYIDLRYGDRIYYR